MRKLALVSLAALAAAALPAAAEAQPRAGHSWGQPGQRVVVRHGGPGVPGMHRREFRRFERGHVVPQFWWGPQFQVHQWQMYGFPQPMPGHRWIRHYDDAYMIDGRGRVRDHRYGLDWDRYGDSWGYDESGIPVYVGDGDYHPGPPEYDWAEEAYDERGGWDYAEYDRGPGHGRGCGPPRPAPCGPGPYPAPSPAPGYGHPGAYGYGGGYGYGYGYACCATVTITETIVETGGASHMVVEEIEEEVVRQRVRRAPRRAPPRRPIRGERG